MKGDGNRIEIERLTPVDYIEREKDVESLCDY